MASTSPNFFGPLHDLNQVSKLPEAEFRRLIQDNFRKLATNVLYNTLNNINLPPNEGAIPVGTGTTWTILSAGTEGQVLTVDTSAPFGIAWEDAATALSPFSDQIRRLLEGIVLELDELLQIIAALKIIQVDVNGAFIGVAPALNFIGQGNVQLSGQQSGSTIEVTIGVDLINAMNQSGLSLPAGTPVALGGGGIVQANATTTTLPCVGLLIDSIIAGQQTQFQTSGTVTLPDWTAIIGSQSLSVGNYYALSTTAGQLTTTPTTTPDFGGIIQYIGLAVAAQVFKILPQSHSLYYVP